MTKENADLYHQLIEEGWEISVDHADYEITNDHGTQEGTEANIFIKNTQRSFYVYARNFESTYFSYSVPRSGRVDVYDMKEDEQSLARITYFDDIYHFSYQAREPFSELYPTQFEGTLDWVPQQDFAQEIIDKMNTMYQECLADLEKIHMPSPEQLFAFTNDLAHAEYEASKQSIN